jgi:uncharacterized protein (PEP-CTERM system associated)
MLQLGSAASFPTVDPANPGLVPIGADLSQPNQEDLSHQMGVPSGFAQAGPGWTILPWVGAGEVFNDNIFQVNSPRQWDFATIVAPGVAALGDLSRLQFRLNYQPTIDLHVKEGSQNALIQQLNVDGLLTVVPDLFYVDVRGVAGTQTIDGGIGGIGGLGQTGIGPITNNSMQTIDSFGLAKQNLNQTSSGAVSPYLLYHLGDFGDGKLGVSMTRSATAPITGFAPLPFVGEGNDLQTQSNVEEAANFDTGEHFGAIRDRVTLDANQGEFSGTFSGRSSWYTASNRVDYAVNHTISVYGTVGWEDIDYSGASRLNIDDMTWGFGTTVTPNQDSSITIGYGHLNGTNSLTFIGHYALTARTTLTASYSNTLGTQLEQVASQLDQGAVNNNGSMVNARTGGPLFVGNNALGLSPGVFRFSTLTIGATTVLDRDVISLLVSNSSQTQVGVGAPSNNNTVQVVTAAWSRQLTPKASMNTAISYSMGTPSTELGRTRSLAASISLQYALSESVSTFARYSYLNSETNTQGSSFYQNLAIVGITKQF